MDLMLGPTMSAINWTLLLGLWLMRHPTLSPRPITTLILALALLCLPIAGTTPLLYLRGVFGEFSMTATVVLVALILGRIRPAARPARRELICLACIIAPVALWFYPLSLGLTLVDPYELGYEATHAWEMSAVMVVAGIVAWLRAYYLVVAVLSAALLSYQMALLESDNLWDYLLDPATAITALYYLGSIVSTALIARLRATGQRQQPEHDQVANDGRVVNIEGQTVRREQPVVARHNYPAGKRHSHAYAEPGLLGATALAEETKQIKSQ